MSAAESKPGVSTLCPPLLPRYPIPHLLPLEIVPSTAQSSQDDIRSPDLEESDALEQSLVAGELPSWARSCPQVISHFAVRLECTGELLPHDFAIRQHAE